MTVFRGKDWIKRMQAQAKHTLARIQLSNWTARLKEHSQTTGKRSLNWVNHNKYKLIACTASLAIIAGTSVAGNTYVKNNTTEIFHVYMDGKAIGTVDQVEVIENFILDQYDKLEAEFPGIHMVLNADELSYKSETAFKATAANEATLQALAPLLESKAIGTEIRVDGELVAIVNDEATAQEIFDKIQSKYVPEGVEVSGDQVSILSAEADEDLDVGESRLDSVDFVQSIDTPSVEIDPSMIMDADEVIKKMETGDVAPVKYIVQEGDCVSCIATKLDIEKQVIYDNNPWIVDDKIFIGDELDLTVLQPTLSVKTVETFVETHEIQYETIYEQDDTMRKGQTKLIKPGEEGLKRVTFKLTKINSLIRSEELIEEQILEEPVAAIIKRGTKVVLGQGTGNFRWPVSGAKLTSGYGQRWGKMHQGIDLASSNRAILAADNAKVTYSGWKAGYGYTVILDHLNGYTTLYGHMSKLSVKKGEIVEKGDRIGTMGSTGESTGIHLHFEIEKNGSVQNPIKYLN
jgi:murein DD-endopeptidase MepM/ murein hydrolase activator NlpD